MEGDDGRKYWGKLTQESNNNIRIEIKESFPHLLVTTVIQNFFQIIVHSFLPPYSLSQILSLIISALRAPYDVKSSSHFMKI